MRTVWLVFWDSGFHSVSPLMGEDKRLWKLPGGRDWLWVKLGLALVDKAMLSKSLIQFSADEWGCVPSLYFGLRPNYGRGNDPAPIGLMPACHGSQDCCSQCP